MPKPAGAWRRFAALFYDGMILFAILLIATAILLPFSGNTAIKPHNHIYQLYLLAIWFGFYALFCLKKGQTIGMLAWGIRLQSTQGERVKFWQVLIRFCCAFPAYLLFGLGFFWLFTNRKRQTWQGLISKTKVVLT